MNSRCEETILSADTRTKTALGLSDHAYVHAWKKASLVYLTILTTGIDTKTDKGSVTILAAGTGKGSLNLSGRNFSKKFLRMFLLKIRQQGACDKSQLIKDVIRY